MPAADLLDLVTPTEPVPLERLAEDNRPLAAPVPMYCYICGAVVTLVIDDFCPACNQLDTCVALDSEIHVALRDDPHPRWVNGKRLHTFRIHDLIIADLSGRIRQREGLDPNDAQRCPSRYVGLLKDGQVGFSDFAPPSWMAAAEAEPKVTEPVRAGNTQETTDAE